MFCTVNLCNAVCQLYLSKTEKKKASENMTVSCVGGKTTLMDIIGTFGKIGYAKN